MRRIIATLALATATVATLAACDGSGIADPARSTETRTIVTHDGARYERTVSCDHYSATDRTVCAVTASRPVATDTPYSVHTVVTCTAHCIATVPTR